jgi:hypothetical protein
VYLEVVRWIGSGCMRLPRDHGVRGRLLVVFDWVGTDDAAGILGAAGLVGATVGTFCVTLGGTIDGVAWIANGGVIGSGTAVLVIAGDVVDVPAVGGTIALSGG